MRLGISLRRVGGADGGAEGGAEGGAGGVRAAVVAEGAGARDASAVGPLQHAGLEI